MVGTKNMRKSEIDVSGVSADDLKNILHLGQYEDYKLDVVAPTPKAKRRNAMDVYEKSTGQKFVYGSAAKPAPKLEKGHEHKAPEAMKEMDMEDPMAALLMKLGMRQYIVALQRQHAT